MYEEINRVVAEALSGDTEAVLLLIKKLNPLIYRTIRRYGKSNDKEDDYQIACICILESLADYDSSRNTQFIAYVKSKLKYTFLNQKINGEVSLDREFESGATLLDTLRDTSPSPEELSMQSEISQRLKSGIGELSHRQRQIIKLYYFDDCSLVDIAKCLKLSYRTVVNTKVNAIKKLRRLLDDYR